MANKFSKMSLSKGVRVNPELERLKVLEEVVGKGKMRVDLDRLWASPPAQDGKGHSSRATTVLHPRVAKVIGMIVERGIFPVKGKSDFLRVAVQRFLEYLKEVDPGVRSILGQLGEIEDLLVEERMAMQFDEDLREGVKLVREHVFRGREGMARALAGKMMKAVEGMPDGVWKREFRKKMREGMGRALRGEGGGIGEEEGRGKVVDVGMRRGWVEELDSLDEEWGV